MQGSGTIWDALGHPAWLQLPLKRGWGLLQAPWHMSKPHADSFNSPICGQLGEVLEITELEWNSPLETMAWAGAETQQISTVPLPLWSCTHFHRGIGVAQGADERSACPCTQSPTTATSLPSLGVLPQGAAKTTQMRRLWAPKHSWLGVWQPSLKPALLRSWTNTAFT